MKTTFLTLLFFATAITMTAQEAIPIKKWSFGTEIFPNSTYKIITNDGTAVGEELYKEIEVAKLCLSGQVYVSYKLTSKSSLSIGLGYQNTGNQTKFKQLSFGNQIDSRRGFVYDSTSAVNQTTIYFKMVYNHHNIQLPIFYKYNFTNRFYFRSGISSIFNFSNTSTSVLKTSNKTTRNRQNDNSTDFRLVNFSGNLGLGFSYFKSSKLDLYVQANIETSFMQLSKNAPLNRRPVSIGLIFGIMI